MMRQYELVERVRRYNPDADEDLLNRAYVFAMKAHGTQKRASGDPFFSHPLEVAAILTDLKLDDATIVSAVLHDTVEDTATTREEIESVFGPEIAGLVDGLTKLNKLDFASKHAQQAESFRHFSAFFGGKLQSSNKADHRFDYSLARLKEPGPLLRFMREFRSVPPQTPAEPSFAPGLALLRPFRSVPRSLSLETSNTLGLPEAVAQTQ